MEWTFHADGTCVRVEQWNRYKATLWNDWYVIGNRLICPTTLARTSWLNTIWDEVTALGRGQRSQFRVIAVDENSMTLEAITGDITSAGTIRLHRVREANDNVAALSGPTRGRQRDRILEGSASRR
jgi:hypothetical protein